MGISGRGTTDYRGGVHNRCSTPQHSHPAKLTKTLEFICFSRLSVGIINVFCSIFDTNITLFRVSSVRSLENVPLNVTRYRSRLVFIIVIDNNYYQLQLIIVITPFFFTLLINFYDPSNPYLVEKDFTYWSGYNSHIITSMI